MGQKDIFERELTKNLVVVADLLNLVLFDGELVIFPWDLEILPGDYAYDDLNDNLRELRRDRYVLWKKNGIVFAFFGIESQSVVDADMPLRGFAYDGASYREQLNRADGRRYPVITFVLYFGEEPWTKNLTLSERLHFTPKVARAVKPYFNDYRVNVIDVRRLAPEDVKKLRSVLGFIATCFYGFSHPDEYVPLPAIKSKTDGKLIALFVKTFVKMDDVSWIPFDKLEEGEYTMGELLETMMERRHSAGVDEGIEIGTEKGIEIGVEKGIEKGVAQEKQEVARNLFELGLSIDLIAKAVRVDPVVVESWLVED